VGVATRLIGVVDAERLELAAHDDDVPDLGPPARGGRGDRPAARGLGSAAWPPQTAGVGVAADAHHHLLAGAETFEEPDSGDGGAGGPFAQRFQDDRARREGAAVGVRDDAGVERGDAGVRERRSAEQRCDGQCGGERPTREQRHDRGGQHDRGSRGGQQ
jgi:hypothetical protein